MFAAGCSSRCALGHAKTTSFATGRGIRAGPGTRQGRGPRAVPGTPGERSLCASLSARTRHRRVRATRGPRGGDFRAFSQNFRRGRRMRIAPGARGVAGDFLREFAPGPKDGPRDTDLPQVGPNETGAFGLGRADLGTPSDCSGKIRDYRDQGCLSCFGPGSPPAIAMAKWLATPT